MIPFPPGFIAFGGDFSEPPDITLSRGKTNPKGKKVALEQLVEACKTVFDPDVHIDVYNLGLVYKITPKRNGDVEVDMTLTSPTCPVAEEIVGSVAQALADVKGAGKATVKLVWSPAWDISMLSDEARYKLDLL